MIVYILADTPFSDPQFTARSIPISALSKARIVVNAKHVCNIVTTSVTEVRIQGMHSLVISWRRYYAAEIHVAVMFSICFAFCRGVIFQTLFVFSFLQKQSQLATFRLRRNVTDLSDIHIICVCPEGYWHRREFSTMTQRDLL